MQLIDSLRKAGAVLRDVAPSHVPNVNELAEVVGALIASAEHGESFAQAVEQGGEAVVKLLSPAVEDVAAQEVPAPVVQAAETVASDAVQAAPAGDKLDQVLQAIQGLTVAIASQQHPTVSNLDQPTS